MTNLSDASIPLPLRWMLAHGVKSLTPWHFLDDPARVDILRRQYRLEVSGGSQPISDCLPFAERQDRDDVAAFVVVDDAVTDEVINVHLTWTKGPEVSGFPSLSRHPDFWVWFKLMVDESADWASEDDLVDIIEAGQAVG